MTIIELCHYCIQWAIWCLQRRSKNNSRRTETESL